MSLASKLPRFRWLLPAFVVLVGVVLTIVMHWDDRAGLWWKESQASQQLRDESIWLPGYRVVIDAKPLQGLEEDETSDLAYNPAARCFRRAAAGWPGFPSTTGRRDRPNA